MAAVASQLVLHPTASNTVKLLGTTLGRDKIYRSVQYLARVIAWYLASKGYKAEAARWDALKTHLGTGRKLIRLGKPLEHLQAALRAYMTQARLGEQLTTIGRQLGYFGYLLYDAFVWANSIKLINLTKETNKKYTDRAFRLWFMGIVFSIVHGLLKAGRLANESRQLRSPKLVGKSLGDEAEQGALLVKVEAERAAARHQFVIDMLDVWIPASNLGYVNLNDGIVGVCGTLSSLMGLRAQWHAVKGGK